MTDTLVERLLEEMDASPVDDVTCINRPELMQLRNRIIALEADVARLREFIIRARHRWLVSDTCKGHSGWAVGPEGLNGPTIVSRPLCDWCGGRNVAHNLDGDNLCLPCCNKWARAEGIEALEARND